MEQTKGVMLMAHNNAEIDYGQMALINALMIKKNMGVPVCLVTDVGTIGWLKQNHPATLVDYAFDVVRIIDLPESDNYRIYKDSVHMAKTLAYNNGTRIDAYELSPFDETLLVDADFLIMNDSLNRIWGSQNDFMINKRIDTFGDPNYFFSSEQLSHTGISQYWATVVYFRKSEFASAFYDLCHHIKQNYDFYKFMYGFPGKLFRNDFVYSIALHMMNGFIETDEFDLPDPELLFTTDLDVLVKVDGLNSLQFLIERTGEQGNYFTTLCQDVNVHIMNKYSINRHATDFIKFYAPSELINGNTAG